jgi:hypothetical protein
MQKSHGLNTNEGTASKRFWLDSLHYPCSIRVSSVALSSIPHEGCFITPTSMTSQLHEILRAESRLRCLHSGRRRMRITPVPFGGAPQASLIGRRIGAARGKVARHVATLVNAFPARGSRPVAHPFAGGRHLARGRRGLNRPNACPPLLAEPTLSRIANESPSPTRRARGSRNGQHSFLT